MKIAIYLATIVMLVAVFLILLRALRGPTIHDRILSANIMGTKTVILLALLGSLQGRTGFLDIALAYALINFISTIAILKYKELKRLT